MLSSKHIKRSPNYFHFEAVKTTCQSLNKFSKNLTFPRKARFETNDSNLKQGTHYSIFKRGKE